MDVCFSKETAPRGALPPQHTHTPPHTHRRLSSLKQTHLCFPSSGSFCVSCPPAFLYSESKVLCSPFGVGVPFTWALPPVLEGRDFLETTHVRSHLYLLPVITYPYILTSISPSYRKAAQIPDSKASSLSLSIPDSK